MAFANRAERLQAVFVHAYSRYRFGKWEWVVSHYRSWPNS